MSTAALSRRQAQYNSTLAPSICMSRQTRPVPQTQLWGRSIGREAAAAFATRCAPTPAAGTIAARLRIRSPNSSPAHSTVSNRAPARGMAGHSKWQNIRHKKAIEDKKRAREFARLSRDILTAVRLYGNDMASNPRLVQAIANARAASMPKAKIQYALESGAPSGEAERTMNFEVVGPGGVAILVDVAGTNRAKATGELRKLLHKTSASISKEGSLAWMFDRKAVIGVTLTAEEMAALPYADLEELAIDLGFDDVTFSDDNPLDAVDQLEREQALQTAGVAVRFSEVELVPNTVAELTDEQHESLQLVLDKINSELEGVLTIHTNTKDDGEEVSGDGEEAQ